MEKILVSIITIVVTLALMGIGTYAYLTAPKIHIDNTSSLETTKHHLPNNNLSDKQLFNDTRIQSSALENQHENNITISK